MRTDRASWVVLIVEDEPLVRECIAQELRGAGCEVLEASSGENAVVYLQSGRQIDVVFTDIQLAGVLSGWDVAEVGRASQSALPVIYASGNPADRSRRVQDSLFFGKPYDPVKVVEACCRCRRI